MSDINETPDRENDVDHESEETLVSPGLERATSPLEDNLKQEDPTQLGPQEESDREQTINQNTITQILQEFSETLEQDLNQTSPQTTLRPKNSQIAVDLQSVSLRARGIQPTLEVEVSATSP